MNDETMRLLGSTGNPEQTLTATGSGSYRYVGAYKAFRVLFRIGGAVTGTNPTLDMRVQTDLDGVGAGTTVLTFAQVTASQVGYTTAGGVPRYEVPGSDPVSGVIETGANPYVRVDYTVGGTATPTFTDVSVELSPIHAFASRKSGS